MPLFVLVRNWQIARLALSILYYSRCAALFQWLLATNYVKIKNRFANNAVSANSGGAINDG